MGSGADKTHQVLLAALSGLQPGAMLRVSAEVQRHLCLQMKPVKEVPWAWFPLPTPGAAPGLPYCPGTAGRSMHWVCLCLCHLPGAWGSGSSGVHSTSAWLRGNSCRKREHSSTQGDHSCSKQPLITNIDHLPGTAKCHWGQPSSAWSKESVQND